VIFPGTAVLTQSYERRDNEDETSRYKLASVSVTVISVLFLGVGVGMVYLGDQKIDMSGVAEQKDVFPGPHSKASNLERMLSFL